MNEDDKRALVSRLSSGESPTAAGRAKLRTSAGTVHIRFAVDNRRQAKRYKFTNSRNALSADYELWICGHPDRWYLIPVSTIRKMYEHPESYQEYHPDLRRISVNREKHEVKYARGGVSEDIRAYYQASFSDVC